MRIVILGAFLDELADIKKIFIGLKEIMIAKRHCYITKFNNHEILISLSGVGTISAASTTTAICEGFSPDLIILCGVAGGLNSDHRIGDLVLANKIIDADLYGFKGSCLGTPYERHCLTDPHTLKPTNVEFNVSSLLLDIASSLSIDRLETGAVVTSNIFPAPASMFAEIKDLNCSAIEMESSGVFKAAEYYETPVITIRAISNVLNNAGKDLGTGSNALTICSERLSLFLTRLLEQTFKIEAIIKKISNGKILDLIQKHNLIQHPEGGWYRQTFRSDNVVRVGEGAIDRYLGEERMAGTSIIYLLSQEDFSAWHTVQSDETWNYHGGDPLKLRIIDPFNGELKEIILDINSGLLQFTIKAGYVFSAESLGHYSLSGCMVTPGFEFKDFHLVTKDEFLIKYPQHGILSRLAREKVVVSCELTESLEKNHGPKFFNSKPQNESTKTHATEIFSLE